MRRKLCRTLHAETRATKNFLAGIFSVGHMLYDTHIEGMDLIQDIRQVYDNYGFETEILAASIRSPNHIKECALVGADASTAPPAVLWKLAEHPLTTKGVETFTKDWASMNQSIL